MITVISSEFPPRRDLYFLRKTITITITITPGVTQRSKVGGGILKKKKNSGGKSLRGDLPKSTRKRPDFSDIYSISVQQARSDFSLNTGNPFKYDVFSGFVFTAYITVYHYYHV